MHNNRVQKFHNVAITMLRTQYRILQKTKQLDLRKSLQSLIYFTNIYWLLLYAKHAGSQECNYGPKCVHSSNRYFGGLLLHIRYSTGLLYRHTLIYSVLKIVRFFSKWKVCSKPVLSKSVGTIFPTAFAHFLPSCHILVILTIFKLFHSYYICHGDLPSATFGVTVAKWLWLGKGSSED